MKTFPSHVAILVPSVRTAAERLRRFDFQIGPEEIWEGEGTKEIYVEKDQANSLLLMEPIKPGAYQRAMEKRGPGLHHLAIDVLNLEEYLVSLAGSGWLLHPVSVRTIKKTQTAYLSRPGFPALIEVQERSELMNRPLFVDGVAIPVASELTHLVQHIGLEKIVKHSNSASLSVNGKILYLEDLFNG